MTDLIGQTIEQYRIERQIGQGGMGMVYEATDLSLNRRVALKIMHKHLAARESFQQRFVREAQNAARLKHPNIVQIYHFFTKDGQLYLVMELLEGGTLQEYMGRLREQGHRMDQGEAVELVRQVCSGLHYAHQEGMVHRDMKPANILLTRNTDGNNPFTAFRPLIADFGLAKLMQDMQFSQTGPAGTLAYMSPEQILGGKIDARSDIYAVGVILFELVVGYRPFNPQSLRDAVRAHRGGPVLTAANRPPGLPQPLEECINRCLAHEQEDRYQSAHEVALDLRAFLDGSGERAQPTEAEPKPAAPAPAPEPPKAPPRPQPKDDNATHFTNPTWPHSAPSMYPDIDRSDLFGFDMLMINYRRQQLDPVPIRQDIITIGRDSTNHIALQGAKSEVSRNHARIERNREGGYYIIDLGSTNGTYLGQTRLPPNIPQYWDPSQTVRIGDYWLKLDMVANRGKQAARPQQPDRTQQHSGDMPAEEEAPAQHIDVQASLTHVIVDAGSYNDVTIAVTNRSKFVDHYALQVLDLPPEWVVAPDNQLKLLPDKQDTFTVRLHPPRTSDARAGQHPFTLRVASVKYANVYNTVPCVLEIKPFYQFTASIQPRLVRRNQPAMVNIHNEGNAVDYYTMTATDSQYALTFNLPNMPIAVEPGETTEAPIDAYPRQSEFFGSSKVQPFDVQITSKGQPVGGKQVSAALQVNATLPRWVIGVAALLGVLCCLTMALAALGLINANQSQSATATVQADKVQATVDAGLDSDGDGLTDTRELQLGTDPQKTDTDNDGLSDGREVNETGTDPKNRDTDGDTLSDGTEVDGCTSPINKDTNGNTIPDNIDPAPCAAASATPTLTATAIPTSEPPPTQTLGPSPTPLPPVPTPTPFGMPPPTAGPPTAILPPPGLPTSTTIPIFPTSSPTP